MAPDLETVASFPVPNGTGDFSHGSDEIPKRSSSEGRVCFHSQLQRVEGSRWWSLVAGACRCLFTSQGTRRQRLGDDAGPVMMQGQ